MTEKRSVMYNVQSHYQPSRQIGYAWFAAMHSRIDIVLRGCVEGDFERFVHDCYQRIMQLEQLMNRFDPESELSRLNSNAYETDVWVSEDLFRILQLSLEARTQTGGMFDVTVQSGEASRYGTIELHPQERSVRFTHQHLQVDLGGIAKGYAADDVAGYLAEHGVVDFMLCFGNSTIVARGNQPGGVGWAIATEEGGEQYVLHDECLSVSGNQHQPKGHIVNPATGLLVKGRLQRAVVTKTAVEGEIAATVACLLPA